MDRPQKFDPALGVVGNIEKTLWENQYRSNEIFNEVGTRERDDITNRESDEQKHTDSYLDLIEAQQKITDLELRIIALERRLV